MPLLVNCPTGCQIRVPTNRAGRVVRCPKCKNAIRIAAFEEGFADHGQVIEVPAKLARKKTNAESVDSSEATPARSDDRFSQQLDAASNATAEVSGDIPGHSADEHLPATSSNENLDSSLTTSETELEQLDPAIQRVVKTPPRVPPVMHSRPWRRVEPLNQLQSKADVPPIKVKLETQSDPSDAVSEASPTDVVESPVGLQDSSQAIERETAVEDERDSECDAVVESHVEQDAPRKSKRKKKRREKKKQAKQQRVDSPQPESHAAPETQPSEPKLGSVSEPNAIESNIVEPTVSEPTVVESTVVESNAVQSPAVQSPVVESNAVQSNIVDLESADSEIVELNVVEPKIVEPAEERDHAAPLDAVGATDLPPLSVSESTDDAIPQIAHKAPVTKPPVINLNATPLQEESEVDKKSWEQRLSDANADRRMLARFLAVCLMLVAVVNIVPAIYHWYSWSLISATMPLPRWIYLQIFIGSIYTVYAIFLLQVNDWSALRAVSVAMLAVAFVFGAVSTGLLTGSDGNVAGILGIPFSLNRQAGIWCVAMLLLATLMSYWAGKESSNWRRAEAMLQEILQHRSS